MWSQAGPAGPAGTPGAKGARGPKGDKGDPGEISPARSAEGFEVLDNVIERQVVELSLPAGAYLLFGTGVASNDSDAAGQVSCSVYGDMVFAGAVNQTVSAHETATFTAQRAIEVEVDDTISAWCVDPVADDAVWLGLTLTAIPVGDVVE